MQQQQPTPNMPIVSAIVHWARREWYNTFYHNKYTQKK